MLPMIAKQIVEVAPASSSISVSTPSCLLPVVLLFHPSLSDVDEISKATAAIASIYCSSETKVITVHSDTKHHQKKKQRQLVMSVEERKYSYSIDTNSAVMKSKRMNQARVQFHLDGVGIMCDADHLFFDHAHI